jgi:hypothetical protein
MSLERLCRRFEIAVGNFGRSCIAMRANEKAFQAWYAAAVIQEFGMSRVYREVHLDKRALFQMVGRQPFTSCLKLETGHELFPDLSVSWEPDVDARHSSTRRDRLRHPGDMLMQFGVLSELKVTGSTGKPTPLKLIHQDLAKLGVFAAAHKIRQSAAGTASPFGVATYMVILDNFCDDCDSARPHYEDERMDDTMEEASAAWPANVSKPVVLLLCPQGSTAVMKTYRSFSRTDIDVEVPEPKPDVNPEAVAAAAKSGATRRRKRITEAEFYELLSANGEQSISGLVRSVIQEAPAHELKVDWGSGPAFHYIHQKPFQSFSFGFFTQYCTYRFGWIPEQCVKVGLPAEIGEDFLHEVAALLTGSDDEEQPLGVLLSRKSEWFAAVDRAVTRIRDGLQNGSPTE